MICDLNNLCKLLLFFLTSVSVMLLMQMLRSVKFTSKCWCISSFEKQHDTWKLYFWNICFCLKKGTRVQCGQNCSSRQVFSLLWTDLNDSDTGVRVPSPLSTTRKILSWSPSRYTRKVTCLLGRDFSHISSLPAPRQSVISLTESSVTVTAGNEKKQDAGHTNQYQTGN